MAIAPRVSRLGKLITTLRGGKNMLSKILILTFFGSSVIGGGVATGIAPTGIELAAGSLRIAGGSGQGFDVHLDAHSPIKITIKLKDDRNLLIKL
jgi:hypothetical protein